MRFLVITCLAVLAVFSQSNEAWTQTNTLRYLDYEVLFTNPVCHDYLYGEGVLSLSGEVLTQKPKNVWCSRRDSAASGSREGAPQRKLLSWIDDPETKEVFFTYLSFSNSTVKNALCRAIEERSVKVTFVLDSGTDLSTANALLACRPANGRDDHRPKLYLRGNSGGIGYAHNKTFMINPTSGRFRIAFSSGNMSSGIVLHHENWHFVTPERDTYFAQAHLCMKAGVVDHARTAAEYRRFIKQCREAIPYPEESDIKVFFVPAEGDRATKFLLDGIKAADGIRLAAHRFSYNRMLSTLRAELRSATPPSLEIVVDDDIWWAGQGEPTGDNTVDEYRNVEGLVDLGAEARWMETNHTEHLLHHNKFLIFNMPEGSSKPSAVFCGAGNLTGTAFTKNFENFYYVEIPEVVAAYNAQYDHLWENLATPTGGLPSEIVLPVSP
jgi:hypothetical protein